MPPCRPRSAAPRIPFEEPSLHQSLTFPCLCKMWVREPGRLTLLHPLPQNGGCFVPHMGTNKATGMTDVHTTGTPHTQPGTQLGFHRDFRAA